MPDYLQGKIYTIRCKSDNSLIYVGSTTQSLSMRMAGHRKEIYNENRKHYTKKLYQIIREMDNLNEWYIELYENFPCNNKEELLRKEGEIIRQIGTLNKEIAGRTKKEYRAENKERIRERDRIYEKENKEQITARKKEYYEKVKERKKEQYEQNKEKIMKIRLEKILCCCGCEVTRTNIAAHQKTKKHLDKLEIVENVE
jgi:hypothetical protein